MPRADVKHPSAKDLAEFGLGRLARPAADSVAAHLAACADCQERLAAQQPDSFVAKLRAARPKGQTVVHGAQVPTPVIKPILLDLPPELAALRKFEVLGKLGEGGMGSVWKAKHNFLGSVVAVKVMSGPAVGDADARHRFLREMRAAGTLQHPNIVRAFDAEQAGTFLYLVMEYVEGISLDRLVGRRGALPMALACRCAQQAAQGLQHAFEKKMIHRDIKPANLMLAGDNTVKILDFGLARLDEDDADRRTRLQVFMGTADFVAPEQALDARGADIRSDIYSLGCTLYFLLAGRPPFTGANAYEVAAAHLTDQPEPLANAPPALWDVVAKMMSKDRNERPQTPAEVVEALAPFARADAPPPLPPPPPVPTVPRRRGWKPYLMAVGAGAIAAVVISATLFLFLARSRPPRKPPELPEGFAPLFNGRDLTGWVQHPDSKSRWVAKNGILVNEGNTLSYLFTKREDFENVHLFAWARVQDGGNSGLFVRKDFTLSQSDGYQADLSHASSPQQTGRILGGDFAVEPGRSPPLGDWVELEFIVQGYRLTTKVNGRVTASGLDARRHFSRGRIALEHNGPKAAVEFAAVGIKELRPEPQLLRNPGCESPVSNGNIPGWQIATGRWTARTADPAPREGKAYFFAGDGPRGELYQDVDLSRYARDIDDGRLGVTFEAYVATLAKPRNDISRVIIEYLDAGKASILSWFDSTELSKGEGWQKVSDSRVLPREVRWARVRLISVRQDGVSNDGFFDDLWLKADIVLPLN